MVKKKKQLKTDELPLVAIDLGSDSVRAMAAEFVADEVFRVLGVQESRKSSCIEHGIVRQSPNAAYMIGEVLRLLSNQIGTPELPTAFVCLGGQKMKLTSTSSKRDLIRRREITQKILDEMEHECCQKIEDKFPDVAVLGVVPVYFDIDGQEQDELPVPGQMATQLCGHYCVFYSERAAKTQTQKSFDQAAKSIEHSFARPEALLSAFASEDGNEILSEGCAVLDLGAQTTTLTIFKGGSYLYNKVEPRGGWHITKLLEQQGIRSDQAELIKRKYGYACPETIERNLRLHIPNTQVDGEELVFTSADLSQLIESKLREILQPLFKDWHQYEDRISRLYVTGGASMLQGIDVYLQKYTRLPVMYGAHDLLLKEGTDPKYLEPTYSALVGTILLGHDYRQCHKDNVVPEPTSLLDRVKQSTQNMTIDLFSGNQEQY